MPDIKISIIVPVYNSEKYLPETAQSILKQSFSDFELILVDLREVFGTDELEVNSIHHQAVKDVGKDFTVTVTAPDGIIEGIEIPGKPIFAVQWHPEMLLKGSDKMLCIFEAFIKLCGN